MPHVQDGPERNNSFCRICVFFLFPAQRATVLTVWRGALNKSVRLEIKGGLASPPPPPLHVVGGRVES